VDQADSGKRQLLARKSNDELLDLWKRRDDYPPDTAAVLQALLSDRGIAASELGRRGRPVSTPITIRTFG
jgi:hypothetical protein